MNQDPREGNICDVCQQPFNSERELQSHRDRAHGQNESGEKQSNYDVETDQPNQRRIA
jgi:hypothetical protein